MILSRAANHEQQLRPHDCARRGFTLVELMIVSVMLAVLFSAIMGFTNRIAGSINDVTRTVKQGREGPAILTLLERDLGSVWVDPRMKAVFSAEKKDGTEMRFVTSRDSILYLNGVRSPLTEVGYKLDSNEEKGSAKLFTLYRREDVMMDDYPLEGGLWIPVADNIIEFTCTFYKLPEKTDIEESGLDELRLGQGKLEALTEWHKDDRYLPYAVKILLRLDIREGEDRMNKSTEAQGVQTFTTIVRLPPFPRNLPEAEDGATLKLNPLPKKGKTGDDGKTPEDGKTGDSAGTGGDNTGGDTGGK